MKGSSVLYDVDFVVKLSEVGVGMARVRGVMEAVSTALSSAVLTVDAEGARERLLSTEVEDLCKLRVPWRLTVQAGGQDAHSRLISARRLSVDYSHFSVALVAGQAHYGCAPSSERLQRAMDTLAGTPRVWVAPARGADVLNRCATEGWRAYLLAGLDITSEWLKRAKTLKVRTTAYIWETDSADRCAHRIRHMRSAGVERCALWLRPKHLEDLPHWLRVLGIALR